VIIRDTDNQGLGPGKYWIDGISHHQPPILWLARH
jgi:hypothetical protein